MVWDLNTLQNFFQRVVTASLQLKTVKLDVNYSKSNSKETEDFATRLDTFQPSAQLGLNQLELILNPTNDWMILIDSPSCAIMNEKEDERCINFFLTVVCSGR